MSYVKQNDLLLNRLLEFYREDNNNMQKMLYNKRRFKNIFTNCRLVC